MMSRYSSLAIVAIALIAGVSDARSPEKIVGGQRAVPGEFPYQVSLRVNGSHLCGGSIITNRFVITALHCINKHAVNPFNNVLIVTGSVKADNGQTHTVKLAHYYVKNESNPRTLYDDIVILELNGNITFNLNQTSVPLPDGPTPIGVTADVTGWGSTSDGGHKPSNDLMKLKVTTLTNEEVRQYYKKNSTVDFYVNEIYAIGAPSTGFCNRDSGGGLVHNGKLIGVVSRAVLCAYGYPDTYTDVYYYIGWIRTIISR